MSREFVVLARLELGEQEIDVLLNLAEFRDERLSPHHRVISRYSLACQNKPLLILLHAVYMHIFLQNGAVSCEFMQNCIIATRTGILA